MFIYSFISSKYKKNDAFIVGSGLLIVLMPWHIRQYLHYDKLVIFAPARTELIISSVNTDENNYSREAVISIQANEFFSYEEYLERFEDISGMTSSRMDNIKGLFTKEKYQQMINAYEKKYSKPYSKYLSRLKGFWNIWQFDFSFSYGGDTRIMPPARLSANLINIIMLTPMFLFFIPGIIYSLRRKTILLQILILIVLSHWILHGFIHYITRYRITVMPLIFLISWYGIYEICKIFLTKKQKFHYSKTGESY